MTAHCLSRKDAGQRPEPKTFSLELFREIQVGQTKPVCCREPKLSRFPPGALKQTSGERGSKGRPYNRILKVTGREAS